MKRVLIMSSVALMCAPPLAAQALQCPGGSAPVGDVGIFAVRCVGPAASCEIRLRAEDGLRHRFSVEPIIQRVADHASTQLQDGDVLVAVDDLLITTVAGGHRLASLPVDAEVSLLVRRAGELREVRVRTRAGCGITSLTVTR